MRERAEVLRQNLRSSHEKAIAENLPKIQEMRRLTDEARKTAQELRQQYRGAADVIKHRKIIEASGTE